MSQEGTGTHCTQEPALGRIVLRSQNWDALSPGAGTGTHCPQELALGRSVLRSRHWDALSSGAGTGTHCSQEPALGGMCDLKRPLHKHTGTHIRIFIFPTLYRYFQKNWEHSKLKTYSFCGGRLILYNNSLQFLFLQCTIIDKSRATFEIPSTLLNITIYHILYHRWFLKLFQFKVIFKIVSVHWYICNNSINHLWYRMGYMVIFIDQAEISYATLLLSLVVHITSEKTIFKKINLCIK